MISKMCTFSCRLPMARSRIPAPRSPGNATRRNGASASSSHSASPSSPLLSSPRCSSPSKCAGSHFFLRFEQSAQLVACALAEGDEAFLIGEGQGQARGGARPNGPVHAGQPHPSPRLTPAAPAGRPGRAPEGTNRKNGRFRWAVEGFWGLQTGCGVGKTPLEAMGGK